MASKKVTIEQLRQTFEDLKDSKAYLKAAKKRVDDLQEEFDRLTKRSSSQTAKIFLMTFCTDDIDNI
jgi:hypothetical protein